MPDNLEPYDPFNQNNSGPQLPPIPEIPQFESQPGYAQVPIPPPYSQKPKRKVLKWVIIGVITMLLLCGLGIGGCTYFVVSKTKPVFDVANKFYKAAKNGENVEDLACAGKYTSDSVSPDEINEIMSDAQDQFGEIQSYDFNSYNYTNGFEEVKGTVIRDDGKDVIKYEATVTIKKEDGDYKVCGVHERNGKIQ